MSDTAAWLTFAGVCVASIASLAAVFVGQKARTDVGKTRDEVAQARENMRLPSNGRTTGEAIEGMWNRMHAVADVLDRHVRDMTAHNDRRKPTTRKKGT